MGVKIVKITDSKQKLKLISVTDTAIDWEETYSDELELTEDEKKKKYQEKYNIQDLRFVEGEDKPTLFVFEHPKRQDISQKIRDFFAKQERGRNDVDMHTEVWNRAYIGIEEGFDESPLTPGPRRNGVITPDHIQALEDSDVFNELAQVVLIRMLAKNSSAIDKKK